tara:strand:- start:22 stop:444 length:423 start_codon:yes stop_codon:yes gene_type:complete
MHDFIETFLREEGFPIIPIEGSPAFMFGFMNGDLRWKVLANADEDDRILTFLSYMPDPVPEARLAAVAERMMRINMRLSIGHFELDFDDGEARFRTAIDLDGTEPTHQLVRQLLRANLQAMGAFLEELQAVAGTEGDDGP